jgi:hypothetical protein
MKTSVDRITAANALSSRLFAGRNIALILMTAMILPPTAVGQSTRPAVQQPPPLLEYQFHAGCLLKITCDPAIFPLDMDTVNALINSAGVTRAAFREVMLNKDREDIEEPGNGVLEVLFEPMGDAAAGSRYRQSLANEGTSSLKTILGRLTVKSESYGGAVVILAHICTRLQDVLNKTYGARLQSLKMQVGSADEEVAETEKRLVELQKYRSDWCAKYGQNDLSRPALLGQSNELEKEKQRLEMELAGQQARHDALQQRIAEIGKQVTALPPEKDPMVNALQLKLTMLRQRQERVKALEQSRLGPTSAPAVDDVAVQVAMAEAELLQQYRKATAAAGGDTLARLNEQLADDSIATTQSRAQLKQVQAHLDNIAKLLASADEYERKVDVLLPLARQAYEAAVARQQMLQSEIKALQPPVVTVIGGVEESK